MEYNLKLAEELDECNAMLVKLNLKVADRLADYEEANKLTPGFGDAIAVELMIFHLVHCLALGLL